MNEAGRRLVLFAAGMVAVFGLGLVLGGIVGPVGSGDTGHDGMDHTDMEHPEPTDGT